MHTLIIFPVICILLSVFSWIVTFTYATKPVRALGVSVLITAPFIFAGLFMSDRAAELLLMSSFALAPLTSVFVTYALFKKLGYAQTSHAWARAILLFLFCAIGIIALFYAWFILVLRHYPQA